MKTIFAAIMAMMLAACSTGPTRQDIAADEANAAKVRSQAAADQRSREQARMEANVAQVPAWALQAPAPDANGIFAVGMGESDKIRESMRKAMLDAEFGLAKNFNQELSGSERSYTQDANSRVNQQQYTELIDKLVSQVPVVGFEVVKQEVKPIDGVYSTYVLLKLPYDQFNRVLQERRATAASQDIKEAFNDLQKRLDARRKQRIEEDRLKQGSGEPATTLSGQAGTSPIAAKVGTGATTGVAVE